MYRGRFAPSPTGDLHLGSAATALVAWLSARKSRGAFVRRVEDLDTPRVVPGAEAQQVDDLRWLGLDWDEGPDLGGLFAPYRQSERTSRYEAAIGLLEQDGKVYLCDCSRADIARAASAPHEDEEGPRYPGTCRPFGMEARAFKRPPALRLAVPDRAITVVDALQGSVTENVFRTVGDFVLRRGDGIHAYQLAVTVDDLAMNISEVVRGADLLRSAPRQALLAEMLGGTPPTFAHVPMVTAKDGSRLAKRARGVTLRDLREVGMAKEILLGEIAEALGLTPPRRESTRPSARTIGELIEGFDRAVLAGRKAVAMAPLASSGAC